MRSGAMRSGAMRSGAKRRDALRRSLVCQSLFRWLNIFLKKLVQLRFCLPQFQQQILVQHHPLIDFIDAAGARDVALKRLNELPPRTAFVHFNLDWIDVLDDFAGRRINQFFLGWFLDR